MLFAYSDHKNVSFMHKDIHILLNLLEVQPCTYFCDIYFSKHFRASVFVLVRYILYYPLPIHYIKEEKVLNWITFTRHCLNDFLLREMEKRVLVHSLINKKKVTTIVHFCIANVSYSQQLDLDNLPTTQNKGFNKQSNLQSPDQRFNKAVKSPKEKECRKQWIHDLLISQRINRPEKRKSIEDNLKRDSDMQTAQEMGFTMAFHVNFMLLTTGYRNIHSQASPNSH
jgi:hypothetical protein